MVKQYRQYYKLKNKPVRKDKNEKTKRNKKYEQKLNTTAKLIKNMFDNININTNEVILNYFNDPQLIGSMFYNMNKDLFYTIYKNYINNLPSNQIEKLKKDMDWRNPYNYYRSMIMGWILEAGLIEYLKQNGLKVYQNDNDFEQKRLFDPNHEARLDLNIENTIYIEVQHKITPLTLPTDVMIKPWKLKQLMKQNKYLLVVYLKDSKFILINIFNYLHTMKKYTTEVKNYYANGKDAYKITIPHTPIPTKSLKLTIASINELPEILIELVELHKTRKIYKHKNKHKTNERRKML